MSLTAAQLLGTLGILVLGVGAILAGSPLTTWVFRHVERRSGQPPGQSVSGIQAADLVLRGGQVIGLLERTAVFFGILAGWPEAMVGVIALKGLGRFADLQGKTEGAAERFLIGSMTSLIWASLLGGLARVVWELVVTG
ncbi:MAG TPA: hypothetical protein P5181_15300 [Dermatophilaceae bacterium]|nr:hypothetical protein [Dermatophilaceae bacterium]